jgi:hypothetical protein
MSWTFFFSVERGAALILAGTLLEKDTSPIRCFYLVDEHEKLAEDFRERY